MEEVIAGCHCCNRYFKKAEMIEVTLVNDIYIRRWVCKQCWLKIDSEVGASVILTT